MKKITWAILISLSFLIIRCDSKEIKNDQTNIDSSRKNDLVALKNIISKEVSSCNANDANTLFTLLHKDVEIISPGMSPVRGDEARKWFKDFLDQNNVKIIPYANEEYEISGDLAYHRYTYEWTVANKKGGEPLTEKGSGLHIFRRQEDGTWLMVKDTWNPIPAETVK